MLPRFKIGVCHCDDCKGKETEGVKVGKVFRCILSHRKEKAKQYTAKAREKTIVRSIYKTQDRQIAKDYTELDIWFKERRKEMTGRCKHCGGHSCKHDDKYFKHSIAHILPKAYFPSVATHPDNWIELCFWNKSCHTQMDNKMLDLIDMNCFDEIITKFCKIYPSIAKEERRRIPSILLQYIETEI